MFLQIKNENQNDGTIRGQKKWRKLHGTTIINLGK